MLERIGIISPEDERYRAPSIQNEHDPLRGVPVGAVLRPQFDGVAGALASAFRRDLDVAITPQPGTLLHGGKKRTLPKEVYLSQPPNLRVPPLAIDPSKARAEEIIAAIKAALDSNQTLPPSPFREGDTADVAVALAMIADSNLSKLHLGKKITRRTTPPVASWLSELQITQEAMSVDEYGQSYLDSNKLAARDAEWYRKKMRLAVANLLVG